MTKGKKQHAQVISFLDGASTRIELGDDDLLACGAALEAGVLDSKGRKLVPVSPRGWEVPRLKVRQTSLGALAPTLLAAMGLEEIVWDAVLSKPVAPPRPACARALSRLVGLVASQEMRC